MMNSAPVLVRRRAPSGVRGRAVAACFALGTGAAAVGTVLGGGLLSRSTPRAALLGASAPVAAAALWLGWLGCRRVRSWDLDLEPGR